MNRKITDAIIKKTKIPNLIDLLVERLSFGELQSLLLKIFELKTAKKDYSNILKEYMFPLSKDQTAEILRILSGF